MGTEKEEKRREFLKNMLRERLSQARDDPRVKMFLTSKEAEEGLNTVIEKVVDNAAKMEKNLGRQLTFEEFEECLSKTLNEFCPKPEYIV